MTLLTLGTPSLSLDGHASATGDGVIFALPARATQLTWQSSFGSAPASITLQLKTSDDGVTYNVVDTSTVVGGESRTVSTSARFVLVRINAISGGTLITVQLLAKVGQVNQTSPSFVDVTATGNLAVTGNATIGGTTILSTLPTSDPHIAGELYNSSGTVKISAG